MLIVICGDDDERDVSDEDIIRSGDDHWSDDMKLFNDCHHTLINIEKLDNFQNYCIAVAFKAIEYKTKCRFIDLILDYQLFKYLLNL